MKCFLQQLKDEKAMSIAEILVSMFILALVGAVILPGLILGFKQVYESGDKSSKVYTVQTELEKRIVTPGDSADGVTVNNATITIKFGTEEFDVVGKIVEKVEEYDHRGSKTKAKVFIPD